MLPDLAVIGDVEMALVTWAMPARKAGNRLEFSAECLGLCSGSGSAKRGLEAESGSSARFLGAGAGWALWSRLRVQADYPKNCPV